MSERCRITVMGKKASLGKATKEQKSLIKACKIGKLNKVKDKFSKGVTKGYQQTANTFSKLGKDAKAVLKGEKKITIEKK